MILMIVFSCLLVSVIFKSRSRVASSTRQQNRLDRDVKLAINCFIMNFIFFACNTPISVVFFLPNILASIVLLYSTNYVFILSYAVNFYILFSCNSLFRKEFLKLLGRKQKPKQQQQQPAEIPMRNIRNRANLDINSAPHASGPIIE